jgi:hypothetical protein
MTELTLPAGRRTSVGMRKPLNGAELLYEPGRPI